MKRISQPTTNFKMTAKSNCAVSTCSPPRPQPIKVLAPDCQWREVGLWTHVHPSLGCQHWKLSKLSFWPTWPLYWLLSSEQPDPTFCYTSVSPPWPLWSERKTLRGYHVHTTSVRTATVMSVRWYYLTSDRKFNIKLCLIFP